jgi:NAD(P)-dependent dehydrogenase (short-subunit alcohol dehydrogenase family)
MDLQLAGKRAIITGAGSGIGLAVARALAREGTDVALVGREFGKLSHVVRLISHGNGGRAVPVPADTTDDASVRAMVEVVIAEFGGVDILVNAAARPAGSTPPAKLADLTDDDLRAELETKVLGYLRCARAVAPHMIDRNWGRIINISGLNARFAGSIAGSIRNVAVSAMTKNLADELGRFGVNVTVVHPGMTVTERTGPMIAEQAKAQGITEAEAATRMAAGVSIGRLVSAGEVADVVTFLASPLSVAITGDAIAAGGGARGAIHY